MNLLKTESHQRSSLALTRRDFLRLTGTAGLGLALASCVPQPITPDISTAITPARTHSKKEVKEFSTQAIGKIFQDAYIYAKQQSNNPYENPWTKDKVSSVHGFLSAQLEQLPSNPNPTIAQMGREIADLAFDKYYDDLPGMYKSPTPEYRWLGYVRAMKEIMERQSGVVVHLITFGLPPTVSISTDVEPAEEKMVNPMGAKQFPVYVHKIRGKNIVLDTVKFLTSRDDNGIIHPWQRAVANTAWFRGKREIYTYYDNLLNDLNFLLRISRGERFSEPDQLRDHNNPEEKRILSTVQKIIHSVFNNDGALLEKALYEQMVAHESAHAMEAHPATPQFEEARSYLEELRSTAPKVAQLSLARMLYEISSKDVTASVRQTGNYMTQDPNISGMQLVISDLVETISNDQSILQKIGVSVKKKEDNYVDSLLPSLELNHKSIVDILANLDKLEGSDLNKLADVIKDKKAKEDPHWLSYNNNGSNQNLPYYERVVYKMLYKSEDLVTVDRSRLQLAQLVNPFFLAGLIKEGKG